MISIHLSPLTTFPPSQEDFDKLELIPTRHFTDWLQPVDQEILRSIKKFVQEREGSWDKIIALGMGGSALGIVTLQKAFFPFDERLVVIDNLDSTTIQHHLSHLNPERTLVLVISKSGGTLETMTNYEVFKSNFSEVEYQNNFIAITDPEEGKLRKIAEQDGLTSFPIPPMIGGRFSVLTAVGLLPFALLGGNIDELLKGSQDMLKRCLDKSEDNPAIKLAKAAFELNNPKTPKAPEALKAPITTFLSYSDQLFPLGLWYQQLLAESIGKSEEVGLTPLPLRGASDQHSVLQLLQEGPNDKLNIFIDLLQSDQKIPLPSTLNSQPSTIHDLLRLECQGTEQALREDGRPTIIIQVPEVSEYSMGELFMLFQMQIALLGEFFQIDAFDQPGVEKSKKIVKTLLGKS